MSTSKLLREFARITPWELAGIVRAFTRAHFELHGTRHGARVRCFGSLNIPNPDGIVIGKDVTFLGGPIRTSLRCERGAELSIGDGCMCNYGAEVTARRRVRIGSECRIASHVYISDDDGQRTGPVTIGHGVWIAHGAVVLPGTVVGDGSVIATLAVVSGVVPPRSLVVGNPGQILPLDPSSAASPAPTPAPRPLHVGAAPAADDVRAAIIEWFDDTRCFGEAATRITTDTMSLVEAGLLDSLGLVQLIIMLEKRFGVVIDRERAARPGSQTIRNFIECVVSAAEPNGAHEGTDPQARSRDGRLVAAL
jgi:maltose O-acetyltransferase